MAQNNSRIEPSMSTKHAVNRTRQIDFGWFTIFQNNVEVGRVCVLSPEVETALFGTSAANNLNRMVVNSSHSSLPASSVEHWWLLPGYKPPSWENTGTTLTFVCDQNSTMTDEAQAFQSLSASMAQRGAVYIRAECVLGASPAITLSTVLSNQPSPSFVNG